MVKVRWRDAKFDLDDPGQPIEDFVVETLGWIVRRGERFLTIASEQMPGGEYRALTHIPWPVVLRIEYLSNL